MVYLVSGKIFYQLAPIFNAIGQICILENSQTLNKLSSHLVALAPVRSFMMCMGVCLKRERRHQMMYSLRERERERERVGERDDKSKS